MTFGTGFARRWLLAPLVTSGVLAALLSPAALAQTAAIQVRVAHTAPGGVWGRHGAVATAETHASRIGIQILRQGGNSVDAAVAIGFALEVTHPEAGNIGGGGFMLVRMAPRAGQPARAYFVDFREEAPGAAGPKMYLDAAGNYIPNSSILGYRAIGIPGTVAGLVSAEQRLGKLGLKAVMAPAIRLAADGYHLDRYEAQMLHAKNLSDFPVSRRLFQRDGNYYRAGDLFRQPELAATLRAIARGGAQAFYRGRIARQLAGFLQRHGGLITTRDLAHYRAIWRRPLVGHYRGYTILTSPPPSSGGVVMLEMFHMLEPTGYWRAGLLSAAAIHDETEAMRRAFADRAAYLGDPDFNHLPLATLLSRAYARQRWQSVRPDAATPSSQVTGGPIPKESSETTHYSVVDAAGDAVGVTYTLNNWFGSGVTAGSLGFLLNDEMDDFTSQPGRPNMFGLVQSAANDIKPYKRPLSSMTPTMLVKNGRLVLDVGSPGGPRIITTVFEVITDMVDFHLDLQQAVAAPRFHQQWLPDVLYLEGTGFSPDTEARLRQMGYHLKIGGNWCDTEAVWVNPKTGAYRAVTDPRADGTAMAY